MGGFGGHSTGTLKIGDVLHLADLPTIDMQPDEPAPLTHEWSLAVLYGPHGAPDFFQRDDIADLFSATYEVHFNSARTGVRLIGPTPRWARPDGGEAGLHPSNLHDNAYAIGSIDFTGDCRFYSVRRPEPRRLRLPCGWSRGRISGSSAS